MKEKKKESRTNSSAGPTVDREHDFPRFRIDVMTKSDKSLPANLRMLGNIKVEVQRKIRKEKD